MNNQKRLRMIAWRHKRSAALYRNSIGTSRGETIALKMEADAAAVLWAVDQIEELEAMVAHSEGLLLKAMSR